MQNKRSLYMLEKARIEIHKLSVEVQKKLYQIFLLYEVKDKITKKEFKKLKGSNLFEFRIKDGSGIYRALAGKIQNKMVILSVFQKKSVKTPEKEIKKAKNRLKNIKY
jgi:phage-related protein